MRELQGTGQEVPRSRGRREDRGGDGRGVARLLLNATPDPIGAAEFAGLIGALGPFEARPTIAVAVSGGADSLALALLVHDWTRARGGRAIGLTVDHGLRPDSAAEAARVAAWLAASGMDHATLAWSAPKPTTGIQAAARRARHDLIETWCRDHGVLHVAFGHQRDDQAETYRMRRRHGSGSEGLAAMAAIVEWRHARLLRPLLAVGHDRLEATLRARGQPWIEDPSNRDPAFERVRLRADAAVLARRGWPAARLALSAEHHGAARAETERDLIAWLGRAVTLHPAGFATIDGEAWRAASGATRAAALARLITTVGGRDYAPGQAACARAAGADPRRPRTLGGCVILPRHGNVIVARETRAPAPRPPRLDAAVAVPHLHMDRLRMSAPDHPTTPWCPPRPLAAPFLGRTANEGTPGAALAGPLGRAKMLETG